ncbi:hypothetical protein INT45_000852 [Circinella minor]|uniref:F-box domain-containing protein n=1 Tax=Circinella minor TaxID=1195481 RepID=A0A8H7S642_9FUNG|nr:hypothetical protein INT45_000852 [Circinella minor]
MTTIDPSFPLYVLDVNTISTSFTKVGKAIDNLDYKLAANWASASIDQIRRSLLFTVLEHRAYALSKLDKFEAAIKDAKEMISIAPNLSRGYLILCNIYAIQGKQQHIIDLYETALENIKDFSSPQQQLLTQEKSKAEQQNKKCVDFVTKLPKELLYSIFSHLDQRSKSICCWDVSKKWRNVLLKRSMVWPTLNINDDGDQITTRRISKILPHISAHIRTLIINTEDQVTCSRYLVDIYQGYLNSVKTLQIKMKSIKDMKPALLKGLITMVIPQLGNILTDLTLDFLGNETDASSIIKLSDLLFAAPKLKHLEYTVSKRLSNITGDFTRLTTLEHPLIDLHLNPLETTRISIEPLLKHCRQLRCLNVHYCMEDFTDLLKIYCPNLQLLGYNFDGELKNRRRIICDNKFISNDHVGLPQRHGGLRELYMADYSMAGVTKFQHFMSLIKNNATTLEVINIYDFRSISKQQQYGPSAMDDILKLPKLKNLTIGISDEQHPIASLLLRSFSFSPALTTLRLPKEANLQTIVDSLLSSKRPLQNLKLALVNENSNNQLMRLFNYYISLSSLSSYLTPTTSAATTTTLNTIELSDETNHLTNKVLDVISNIKTIKWFGIYSESTEISMEGLTRMFKKLNVITHVELGGFNFIDDKEIVVIAQILKDRLTHIRLYHLNNLTTFGVILLMEYATRLKNIFVSDCPMIEDTKAIEEFAKMKEIDAECYCW